MPRFTFERLTAEQFAAGLAEANITTTGFARLTGADLRRIRRWRDGAEADIPVWAGHILLALTVPEARQRMLAYADLIARQVEP